MKSNEAPDFPEKVYIPRDPESPQSPNIWWEREPSESNIEYTRTDVFIKKACEWFKSHGSFTIGFDGATVKDFLDYINK